MADTGYEWADGERVVYERAVQACLGDRRLAELLVRRPTLTSEAVTEAMCAPDRVRRLLHPRLPMHRRYRRISRRCGRYRWAMPEAGTLREWLDSQGLRRWRRGAALGLLGVVTAVAAGAPWSAAVVLAILLLVAVPLGFLVGRVMDDLPSGGLGRGWRAAVLVAPSASVACLLWFLDRLTAALWIRELRRGALPEEVAQVVEELLGDDRGTLLVPSSHDGLRSPNRRHYFVKSGSAAELERKIAQLEGGTIAVSGPRGVGKTTLMEHSVRAGDFSVFAHAPATYAPYDFLTSLFVTVCQGYITRAGYAAPDFVRLSYVRRTARLGARPLVRFLRWLAFASSAAALVAIGLFATERALRREHGPWVRQHVASLLDSVTAFVGDVVAGREPEGALTLTVVGIVLWNRRKSASFSRAVKGVVGGLHLLVTAALVVGPFASLAFDPDIRRHADALLSPVPLALIVVWLLCWASYHEPLPDDLPPRWRAERRKRLLAKLVKVLPVVILLLWVSDASVRPLLTDSGHPVRISVFLVGALLWSLVNRPWSLLRSTPELVTACRDHLYRLQTVQNSTAALTTGAAQLLTLGTSHTSALTTVPPNHPALVAEFRGLLTRIARDEHEKGNRVVIAIDEVDRLGTDTQALAFLGEIKAILGVPHVHYLISVAEDVGAAFVRRGLPHRDVTDSSLDDVLHVRPCTLAESTRILAERAPGMGDAYVLLAHALSGGVPRDLIRYGRRLMEIRSVISQVELPAVAQALIIEELSETLAGFRTLLAKQQRQPGAPDVLGSFRGLAGHLRVACPCPERMDELRRALAHFVAQDTDGLPDESRQLVDEAAAYACLSLTLVDVFGLPGFNRRAEAAQRSPHGDPDVLAEARQELALSPYSARPVIDGIRRAWGLEPVPAEDTPGLRATVLIPPRRGTPCEVHRPRRALRS